MTAKLNKIQHLTKATKPRRIGLMYMALCALALLAGGGMVAAGIGHAYRKVGEDKVIRSMAMATLMDEGHGFRAEVARVVRPAIERTHKLAADPQVIAALRDGNVREEREMCNEAIQNSTEIDAVAIFDAEGKIQAINTVYASGVPIETARVEKILRLDFGRRDIIQKCVKNESDSNVLEFQTTCDITPAFFDSSGLSVAYSVPVRDPVSGKKLGVVSSRQRFERLTSLTEGRKVGGREHSVEFVADNGKYFSESINTGKAQPPVPQSELAAMVAPMVKGDADYTFTERRDDAGRAYICLFRLGAFSTLDGGGLQVMFVVGRDWLTREAMLSQRLETAAMIGVGVLMALVAVLLYAVAKLRQRKNELQELTGELLRTQQSLVSAARQAGMAEIANGVLHNLGNALNSVNVSLACAEEKVRDNPALEISKVSQLLGDHQSDLGEFLTKDERGKQLPGYLETLSLIVMEEQKRLLTEFSSLSIGIEHVKDIVNTHQAYAGASLVCEPSKPADIILDALRMSTTSLARHSVKVVKKLADIPALQLDRHKILQILLNFISNAIDALGGTDKTQRTLEICLEQDGGDFVISATDSGAGMAPETLAKIFTHGFTTKKDGHGFGLHSAFLAARSMQGSLTAHSEGLGKGATFVLRLPMKPEPAATGAAAVAGAGLRN